MTEEKSSGESLQLQVSAQLGVGVAVDFSDGDLTREPRLWYAGGRPQQLARANTITMLCNATTRTRTLCAQLSSTGKNRWQWTQVDVTNPANMSGCSLATREKLRSVRTMVMSRAGCQPSGLLCPVTWCSTASTTACMLNGPMYCSGRCGCDLATQQRAAVKRASPRYQSPGNKSLD